MQKKKGISLIVLVITIIVMIILAGAIVIALNNSGVISKTNTAVNSTNEATVKEVAELAWSEAYINLSEQGILTEDNLKKQVNNILNKQSIDLFNYSVEVTLKGVTVAKKVIIPKLANGMKAVYWDENGNEIAQGDENFNILDWYDYEEQTTTTENGGTSRWANAKTEDGSYWVWIPRYEYKITYYTNNTYTTLTANDGTTFSLYGDIDVNFILATQTTPTEGYKIHPAFQNGTSNNFMNGEWDAEISGIWVAKYEMSRETSSDSGVTWTTASGINAVTVANTSRVVSKPSVSSWRSITIGNMYTTCQEYDNHLGLGDTLNSHLIKNSEWGAVAYLTHSKYGRNKTELNINACSSYMTGAGSTSPTASAYAYDETTFGTTYAYDTINGKLASSTGNITGIYDLYGGAWEYPAAYITNGNSNLSYGSSFINETIRTTKMPEGYKTLSTKYVTVYPYYESDTSDATSTDSIVHNYNAYRNLRENISNYGYGDALAETLGWNRDNAHFANSIRPFFDRGGSCANGSNGGVFYSGCNPGAGESRVGFRAVLVVS